MSNKERIMKDDDLELQEMLAAKPEEWLEAAIHFWSNNTDDEYKKYLIDRFMRLGFALAQEAGWEHIAPAWWRDWLEYISIPI